MFNALKSDNIEIMINDESDEVIKELFDSLRKRYQDNFKFNVMNLPLIMLIIHHEINPNCGRSLQITDSSDWIKNKKVTIISINKKDDKCFQYAVTVALHHEQIEKDPQRIIKLIFLSKYNWGEINCQS